MPGIPRLGLLGPQPCPAHTLLCSSIRDSVSVAGTPSCQLHGHVSVGPLATWTLPDITCRSQNPFLVECFMTPWSS